MSIELYDFNDRASPLARRYYSPELLEGQPESIASLLWNIGVLIDEVVNRRVYFRSEREVMDPLRVYRYDNNEIPQLKKTCESLLSKEATQRMGVEAILKILEL